MTTMDRITEEIAHFIGLFHLSNEQARVREAYEKFTPDKSTPSDPDTPPLILSDFEAPYELLDFEPWVRYHAPAYPLLPYSAKLAPWTLVKFKQLQPASEWQKDLYSGPHMMQYGFSQTILLPEIQPPGSIANYLNQIITLSDNDYFGVGGHGLVFSPPQVDNAALLDAAAMALALSPIGNLELPGSAEAIRDFITTASAELEAYTVDADGPAQVFVHKAVTIEGVYVNGKMVDEAPKIEDYHSFDEDEETEDGEPVHNAQMTMSGEFIIEKSVDVEMGGNTLVNNAVMKNFWTASTVTAVVGDRIEFNAIIQINVLYDNDAITSVIEDWTQDSSANQLFNIAEFHRIDVMEGKEHTATETPHFPKHWVVTEIKGDLLIVNWLQQLIYQSDNDIGIVSSSGVTTKIISGDNLGVNDVSIFEMASAYDLIIIGGAWYDANIIHQLNVLFDNDFAAAISGFQTTGEGSLSTSANLLWNQAYIANVGGANSYDALPLHYLEAARNLAAGNTDLPAGVLQDPLFEGIGVLRVLYISGDLLNVQYIKQTNLLGDSDQIALAMAEIIQHPDAEWTITTGENALMNNAAIVDLDSVGKTYVGGQQYSQEVLIQAELISSKPDLYGENPDALANEAVAFLEDAAADDAHEATPGVYVASDHDGQGDGLQTMLG